MASQTINKKQKFLSVKDIEITYDKTILKDLSFNLNKGEVLAIVGISGCGKTTILKSIAGLEEICNGRVIFKDDSVNVGMIFQESTLFPWMTVRGNVEASQYMQSLSKSARLAESKRIIEEVGLGSYMNMYPISLSGGMAQRTEIARTLSANYDLLLMDEPFSKLDVQTRYSIYELFNQKISNTNIPVILVTHSIEEALFLADRILVLSGNPATIGTQFINPLPRPRKIEMLKNSETDKMVLDISKKLQTDYQNKIRSDSVTSY